MYDTDSIMNTHSFFLNVLGETDRAKQKSIKLWVSSSKGVLDTDAFSKILKSNFLQGGVAPLGVKEWRHVSVAICDAHIKAVRGQPDLEDSAMIDLQRGHSSQTANFSYGGTGGYSVDRKSEVQYRQASQAMHRFWGVSLPILIYSVF